MIETEKVYVCGMEIELHKLTESDHDNCCIGDLADFYPAFDKKGNKVFILKQESYMEEAHIGDWIMKICSFPSKTCYDVVPKCFLKGLKNYKATEEIKE